MKAIRILTLALACAFAAQADFSYVTTRKGGPAAGDGATKHYFKGQKMKTESAATASIVDLDAQTITTINNTAKTYTVTKFSDLAQSLKGAAVDAKVDVRETGQTKNIAGYNATEVVMTMAMETPQSKQAGMKMTMETSMWLSPDVPGAAEMRAFYQKNIDRFPWSAMVAGANPSMQKAMADMQKQIARRGGIPLLQITKMNSGGGEAQQAQMQQGMAQLRAQMEAMRKQGGKQAEMAEQTLARMGAMSGGAGSLFEVTMESSGFSTSAVPDSVFAVPAGYTKQ
jgi:transglutaminase/protease-like cytokinesis protein 3